MFSLLWTALIGLVVGALAKLIMPGKEPGGIIITMLLGIAGSFVGTFIGRILGLYSEGRSAGFIMSLIGALIILAIYHFFRRRQHQHA
ncbi:MAG: GlsB/YeaQ/YmgE family stress response membrane protein [Acidobacteriaceae bacterium]|nr:GlsB/YeaQ/YmgE family stress response membrane protein [Acidobacteriaceae bacterium]